MTNLGRLYSLQAAGQGDKQELTSKRVLATASLKGQVRQEDEVWE